MPDMLEDYAESHERFSVSVGKKEENNKLIKLILPPGMPSAEFGTWYVEKQCPLNLTICMQCTRHKKNLV